MDLVIASIRIIAITGQPLSCFHLPHVLIAKCGSLVYSEFKHTHYYIHSAQLQMCKSLVKYLFEANASSTELLGASEQ